MRGSVFGDWQPGMRWAKDSNEWQVFLRHSQLAVASALVALAVLMLVRSQMWVRPESGWMARINKQNYARHKIWYDIDEEARGQWSGGPEWAEHERSLQLYAKMVGMEPGRRDARATEELIERMRLKCEPLTDLERVQDKECRAWWQYVLQRQPITKVGITLGFYKDRKQGAIQVQFDNGMYGWFKPCGTDSEPVEREAVGSMIDFLGGFDRAAPVAMRNVSAEFMVQMARQQAWYYPWDRTYAIMQETFDHCAYNGVLYGSMIGWWHGVSEGRSIPKVAKRWGLQDGIDEVAAFMPDDIIAEVAHDHVFFFLVNINRNPGKNEHMIYEQRQVGQPPQPTLLAIDLDRVEMKTKTVASTYAVCHMCKVGNRTMQSLERMAMMEEGEFNTLLQQSLQFDEYPVPVGKGGNVVWRRAQSMYECFRSCIREHGVENVIVPDTVWN